MPKKRVVGVKRKEKKKLYRSRRRRAPHAETEQQQAANEFNDREIQLGETTESLTLPTAVEESDLLDEQQAVLVSEEGTPLGIEKQLVFSGYVPLSLQLPPSLIDIPSLPNLGGLVQQPLPSLNQHLALRSDRPYKKGVSRPVKLKVELPTVYLPPSSATLPPATRPEPLPSTTASTPSPLTYREHRRRLEEDLRSHGARPRSASSQTSSSVLYTKPVKTPLISNREFEEEADILSLSCSSFDEEDDDVH